MARCFVAFGGNLGPVADTFRAGLAALEQSADVRVDQRSGLYRTAAIGAAGPAYLNAVAAIETSLSPEELLSALQSTEERFGRIRTSHWGPRTIDLDLIAFGDVVRSSLRLTIPHPHCWYRRFVLDPWCDVAPQFIHPTLQETVGRLRQRLMMRPLPVSVDLDLADVRDHLRSIPEVLIIEEGSMDPAITFLGGSRDRAIDISAAADRPAVAEQIVRAALDEPVPIETDNWIPSNRNGP
jgi:2-amino-4-hydroxy-6-hydroxymethyldihydropteridine diphosphokinase